MRICSFCPAFVSLASTTCCCSPQAIFRKNNFSTSYQKDGHFVGVINTLHSGVFVLLGLQEEIVWCNFSSWLCWTGIERYWITLTLQPANQLSEMNDGKVVFVLKFLSRWDWKGSENRDGSSPQWCSVDWSWVPSVHQLIFFFTSVKIYSLLCVRHENGKNK